MKIICLHMSQREDVNSTFSLYVDEWDKCLKPIVFIPYG